MNRIYATMVGVLASISLVVCAGAITIDFEGLTPGTTPNSITDGDVTFTPESPGTTLSVWDIDGAGPFGIGIAGGILLDFVPVRADIAGGATEVSVLLGDAWSDDDGEVFLHAYGSGDVPLGSSSTTLGNSLGFVSVSVSGVTPPPIAYVIWSAPALTGNRLYPNSIIAEEFQYTAAALPEAGATLAFLGLALCAIGSLRRRLG